MRARASHSATPSPWRNPAPTSGRPMKAYAAVAPAGSEAGPTTAPKLSFLSEGEAGAEAPVTARVIQRMAADTFIRRHDGGGAPRPSRTKGVKCAPFQQAGSG